MHFDCDQRHPFRQIADTCAVYHSAYGFDYHWPHHLPRSSVGIEAWSYLLCAFPRRRRHLFRHSHDSLMDCEQLGGPVETRHWDGVPIYGWQFGWRCGRL